MNRRVARSKNKKVPILVAAALRCTNIQKIFLTEIFYREINFQDD